MLVSVSEAFGTGLIDNQMATAFLTGIVAETKRFSNDKTSPKVMTMSAQLMAAGANQQLIVSKLEPPQAPPSAGKPAPKAPPPPKPTPAGVLNVSHKPERADSPEVEVKAGEIHIDEKGNIISSEAQVPAQPVRSPAPLIKTTPMSTVQPAAPPPPPPKSDNGPLPGPHTLLDPTGHQPAISPPFTADTAPKWDKRTEDLSTDPLSGSTDSDDVLMGQGAVVQPPANPTVNTARSAVDNALAGTPFDPALHPAASLGAQPLSQPLHTTSPNPPPPVPPPLMPTPPVPKK